MNIFFDEKIKVISFVFEKASYKLKKFHRYRKY
jgi:hypothetical protein